MPAMNLPASASQPLASIDMGSNSFRLEVARLFEGSYRRSLYLKETVRLGAGLDGEMRLTEDAMVRQVVTIR